MENFKEEVLKHLNSLSDNNRAKRKTALDNIKTLITISNIDSDIFGKLFSDLLLKPLLKMFFDPVEKCREIAINMITEAIIYATDLEAFTSLIMPTLVKRIGQAELVEPSEEIRLQLVNLLLQLILKIDKNITPYLDDLIKITQQTLIDSFADVRKLSCDVVSHVAKTIPEKFHLQADSLVKPLLLTLTHQHSKIRATAIHTLGQVMQYSNGKMVGDVVTHLAQRLFDPIASVRLSVIKVVGGWLLDLPDRYSYHSKLIPLLLTGFSDDMKEVREEAEALWNDIGYKYQLENEQQLKDKIDFYKPDPKHYPNSITRPNLGCRVLIYENFSKILPALIGDLGDWVEATRLKASQLLYFMMVNEEDNVTQHLNKMLQGIVRASNDDQKQVVQWILKSSELVGYFVIPDVWFEMFIQMMKLVAPKGPLAILSAIISGSDRQLLQPYLKKIVDFLSDPSISQIADSELQYVVLSCIENLQSISREDCFEIQKEIFLILLYIDGLYRKDYIKNKSNALIDELAVMSGMTRHDLIKENIQSVLQFLKSSSYDLWTQFSTPVYLLNAIINQTGEELIPFLFDVCDIFESNLKPNKNAELRLQFFTMLSNVIASIPKDKINCVDRNFCIRVVQNMILPNCIWSAGRTAEVTRKVAVTSFLHLLQQNLLTSMQISEICSVEMLTLLKSLLDDDNVGTRLATCQAMTFIFDTSEAGANDEQIVHNLYPDLLKRMDDNSDEVRMCAADMFKSYLNLLLRRGYRVEMYRSHLADIYAGLLIHLDDPNNNIQAKVFDALNSTAHLDPQVLIQLLESEKLKHRSRYYCDKIIQNIQKLSQIHS